jgi:hypothetical protein
MKTLIQLLTLALVLLGTPGFAQNGTILFNSNEPCQIMVDGKEVGVIENVQDILKISVPAGQHLVMAAHRDQPSLTYRVVVEVRADAMEIVLVELAEPVVRLVNQGDGTVMDTETGLLWLKNQQCISNNYTAKSAILRIKDLQNGQCLLTDGSKPGDWRLPTKVEWETILAPGCTAEKVRIVGRKGQTTPACFSHDPWADISGKVYWVGGLDTAMATSSCGACLKVDMASGLIVGGQAKKRPTVLSPLWEPPQQCIKKKCAYLNSRGEYNIKRKNNLPRKVVRKCRGVCEDSFDKWLRDYNKWRSIQNSRGKYFLNQASIWAVRQRISPNPSTTSTRPVTPVPQSSCANGEFKLLPGNYAFCGNPQYERFRVITSSCTSFVGENDKIFNCKGNVCRHRYLNAYSEQVEEVVYLISNRKYEFSGNEKCLEE